MRDALAARGWAPEPWYAALGVNALPLLATAERCADAATAAGLVAHVDPRRVTFPELDTRDLIAWRLGLAQHAPFVATLSQDERDAIVVDALARLGEVPPPLVRSVIVLAAVKS